MNKENYFISQFKDAHIGDDGAVINNYVYSKDAFFENVHYKKKWLSYKQIATKSMMVNISDAIAMNAKPKYALLAVAMPKEMSTEDMKELSKGFIDTANKYNIKIIGGDTISNNKLDITVTIISEVSKPLLRSGVKEGYLFAFTGELGKSGKDLKKLFNLGTLNKKSKFVNIQLRDKFIEDSIRFISSGMDISDGLFSDLDKLSTLNKIGVNFNKNISKLIGCSGEEYEMLIAFKKRDEKALQRHAKKNRVRLTVFGEAVRNRYTNRCKAHHF